MADGRLHGRGACDVKGPMAALIHGVADAARTGTLRATVGVAVTTLEEVLAELSPFLAEAERHGAQASAAIPDGKVRRTPGSSSPHPASSRPGERSGAGSSTQSAEPCPPVPRQPSAPTGA
ncbi:MAG: M20/M25/M40 family metallo-hydrolase [Thermoleophilaceae bacterium]